MDEEEEEEKLKIIPNNSSASKRSQEAMNRNALNDTIRKQCRTMAGREHGRAGPYDFQASMDTCLHTQLRSPSVVYWLSKLELTFNGETD